jgi:hypothetical protein
MTLALLILVTVWFVSAWVAVSLFNGHVDFDNKAAHLVFALGPVLFLIIGCFAFGDFVLPAIRSWWRRQRGIWN